MGEPPWGYLIGAPGGGAIWYISAGIGFIEVFVPPTTFHWPIKFIHTIQTKMDPA
ncbi:MAG: hypothetical protein NVSMB58_37670 [Terriglobales bacterium]